MVIIDGYPFDLEVSAAPAWPSEITDHPTEDGADLSDHIRNMPGTITLECIVSNDPIGTIANDRTRQNIGDNTPSPADDAYARLLDIRKARKPVTIECSFGILRNWGMESLSPTRDAQKSHGLYFSVVFKEIVTTEVKRVTVRAAPIASGGDNLGARAMSLDEKGRIVRRVDLYTLRWFDPVIGGWRARAQKDALGTDWKFYKGQPTMVEAGKFGVAGDVAKINGKKDDATFKQIIDGKRGTDLGFITGIGGQRVLQEAPPGFNSKGERIGGSGVPVGKTITYAYGVIQGAD